MQVAAISSARRKLWWASCGQFRRSKTKITSGTTIDSLRIRKYLTYSDTGTVPSIRSCHCMLPCAERVELDIRIVCEPMLHPLSTTCPAPVMWIGHSHSSLCLTHHQHHVGAFYPNTTHHPATLLLCTFCLWNVSPRLHRVPSTLSNLIHYF